MAGLSKKFLHLLDSMTSCGVKHRSPAPSMQYLVRRVAALEMAADLSPILGYVRTHRNPADAPSRAAERREKNKMLTTSLPVEIPCCCCKGQGECTSGRRR